MFGSFIVPKNRKEQQMIKIRKAIAVVMILLIAVTCIPLGAFAENADGQDLMSDDTVPETTVEPDIEVPPEEETAPPADEESPPDPEPEIPITDPVDDPQEETETYKDGEDNGIPEEADMTVDGPAVTDPEDSVPEAPDAGVAEEMSDPDDGQDADMPEDALPAGDTAEDTEISPDKPAEETETEPEEAEMQVMGNMLMAASPTRGSAYLQMIDMDQYSFSFGWDYPEPFRGQSRSRSVLFWLNGAPAYCLEFGVPSSSGMSYSTQDTWSGISSSDKRLLSWVLRFGYIGWTRYGCTEQQEYFATQVLIWQILSHTVNTGWESSICDVLMGSGSYAQDVYWKIKNYVYAADKIPSFCSAYDDGSTPVYDLERLPEGGYAVELTDTNGVLGSFSFSAEGAEVTRNGNTLTVRLDKPVEELTLSAYKSFSGWTTGNVIFWRPGSGGYQYLGSFDTGKAPEEVRALFRVTSPLGYLDITKASTNPYCTDGNAMYSLEGTSFEVTDAEGNVVGVLTADENGKVETLELPTGTYTVRETAVGKGYIRDESVKTVTVYAGESAEVSFINEPVNDPVSVYLRKWDPDAERFIPQGSGTFAGAQYRMDYFDNTEWEGEPTASWVFRTDEDGVLRYLPSYQVSGPELYCFNGAYLLPLGSISITETKAPEGYLRSDSVLYARMIQDGDAVLNEWTEESQGIVKEIPDGFAIPERSIRGGVRFKKSDIETGLPVAGAEISVYSSSENTVIVEGKEYSNGDLILTLTTDENGICETADDLLPYGSYYAVESKASDMYLLNQDWKVDFDIEKDREILDLTTGDFLLKEQIIRGDLTMLKLDIDGKYMSGVPFMIVKIEDDGTEGERHVIVTDENGKIDTSSAARPHTNNTNGMDKYVNGGVFTDVSRLDPAAGVWFGDSEPDDSLGALPYGRYRVYELQTEKLAADQLNMLESRIVEVTRPNRTVTLAPMVNLNIELESAAASANGKDFIPAADGVGVTDSVRYTNLTSHRKYTMETQFVLRSTSEVLATVSKDFYPPDGPNGTNTAGGEVTLEAEIDLRGHDGDLVVACDYLYEYVMGTKILIASHADMEDASQTLMIPAIRTSARDSETGDSTGTVSCSAGIIDTVFYTNLRKGEAYRLVSKLGDIETGEYIKGADGEDLIAEQSFLCMNREGSMDMPEFRIDSEQYRGRSVVVTEELYWIDSENDGEEVLMTSHVSFDDRDQTVSYPDIHTTASDRDTGTRAGAVSERSVIRDEVRLTGLIEGHSYTVKGAPVFAGDFTDGSGAVRFAGDEIPVLDGSDAEVTFTAEAEEMTVTLTYIIDSEILEGRSAVVFEDLIHGGVKVASHADLEDEEQTVRYPKIRTKAEDSASGTCFLSRSEETVLTDTVSCYNLIPGLSYKIEGSLMDRNTGKPIGAHAVSDVFAPEESDGTVQVEFAVGTEKIRSTVIVVFEDLYLIKEDGTQVLIAKHEDLSDGDQSLYIPEIGTSAVNAETGTHEAQGREKTVIKDTVRYRNLRPGFEYTLKGTLMDKTSGESVIIDGEPVTAEAVFVAAQEDGSVEVIFQFDGRGLAGRSVVVFEKLMYEELEVAVHADIEDEDQSVNMIDIRTSASDGASGSHTMTHGRKAQLIDTVSYRGLTPGKTYTLCGTVMVKGTGEILFQDGIPVTGMTEFTPEEPDGTAQVSFEVDTYTLQGMEIVVFERLYAGSVTEGTLESELPAAVHEDIDDAGQTLSVPEIPDDTPDTGFEDQVMLPLVMMISSGAGLVWIFCRKKRH